MKQNLEILAGLAFCCLVAGARAEAGSYGVTGDIQRRIDAASAAGGGTVTLEAGDYPVASIFLKSGVTLELRKGATLLASTNKADYANVTGGPNTPRAAHAVVCANGATNIALVGEGVVDGRGWAIAGTERDNEPGRWRDVMFYRSKGVRVEGVTLRNAASWTCYFKECEDVVARRVTIRSLTNWNNDGIDIDAKNVLVEDCDIDSDDDAICPKSDNPRFICENVEVRNCRLASNCNHIKLGTASKGGFRNIWIHDCTLVQCATNIIPQIKNKKGRGNDIPGWDKRDIASRVGIAVECVDGGILENVRVSGIRMTRCCQTPILVRLGRRREHPDGRASFLRNVVIENVTGESASLLASSITGVPGLRPSGVTIRNVDLKLMGGGPASEVTRPVPEAEKAYPENRMFKRQMLPAYGFYVRHADGVTFENVKLTYTGDTEARPAIFIDDSTDVRTEGCSFRPPAGSYPAVYATGRKSPLPSPR